jgi:hypothetical protein
MLGGGLNELNVTPNAQTYIIYIISLFCIIWAASGSWKKAYEPSKVSFPLLNQK